MFTYDTALVADGEEWLQDLGYVYKKKKLKAHVSSSKVMNICGNSRKKM